MAESLGNARRSAGGSLGKRSKKRWTIAAATAALWLTLLAISRSAIASSALLLILAIFVGICVISLRSLGFDRRHPVVQSLASRPWRDGQEVFALAMRHLSELFILTPKGSWLAPSDVEVRMNPADVDSLAELIDLDLANELAVESYEAQIAALSARVHLNGPVEVRIAADPEVPVGRYALRQRMQVAARLAAAASGRRGSGGSVTRRDLDTARTMLTGQTTVAEPGHMPMLRLVTGAAATQTHMSGARAGRSRAAELTLPDVPTISRLHARFACENGEWLIASLGRNGVVVNGTPVVGQQAIRDGDFIRWGRQDDAPTSRVEIV
jgi:hypothetical protein